MATLTQTYVYHRVFYDAHGDGPHHCFYCQQTVECRWSEESGRFIGDDRWTVAIHHVDEDRKNNEPENLSMSHFGCRTQHHVVGRKHTEESRARMSISRIGMVQSEETKARRNEALRRAYAEGRLRPPPSRKCSPGCSCGRHRRGAV